MNYLHAFHAGNFADLAKHGALLALLPRLTAEPGALTVIDTHAGAGAYDLAGPEARKSGEAEAGIARLMAAADAPEVFEPLKAAVRRLNPQGGAQFYPGSPRLIADALRPGDRYVACELRPDQHRALSRLLRGDPRVETLCVDGFATAVSRCPAKGRVLVLIDPPFERADDYDRTVDAVAGVLARNPSAAVLVWLPLKDLETFDAFLRDLEDAAPGPLLAAEVRLRPLADPMKMNGCALVLAGSVSGFEGPIAEACNWIAANLGDGGRAQVRRLP